MNLTRRQFFAVSAAATFVASLPRGLSLLPTEAPIGFNLARKTIQLREPIHFKALHRLLHDRWDEPDMITDPVPTLRITDDIYEFCDDWGFADEESRRMIRCGSYREGDDLYSNILVVGQVPADVDILWRTDDAEGLMKPGEAIKTTGKPLVFQAPGCEEYRVTGGLSPSTIPIPMVSPDPAAVDAGTLSREGWADAANIPQGLLVRT